jgi:hypothetical protein
MDLTDRGVIRLVLIIGRDADSLIFLAKFASLTSGTVTFFIRDKVYTNFLYTGQSLYGTKFIQDKVYTGTKFIRGQSLYGDKVYTGQSSYSDKV